jgi:excisionase family DNA binding protein
MSELEAVRAELEALRLLVSSLVGGLKSTEPRAVTLKDAAAALGCSPRHIARMIGRGELVTIDVGGARRIPMRELERITSTPVAPPLPPPKPKKPAEKPARYSVAAEMEKFRARRR